MRVFFIFLFFYCPIFSQSVFKVTPIPGNINTENQEFGPSVSKNGSELYFYSKRNNSKYTDLFKSNWINNKWSDPLELTELNSPYDDQSPFIAESKNRKSIFFSSNRDGSEEFTLPDGKIGVSRDIYYSDFRNNKWTTPRLLSKMINTSDIEENPFLTGNTLYFTRYPFGELKKAKIFSSTFDGKKWSKPEPLPYPINDNSSNIAAIISADDSELIFSSNREKGFGGYDLYRVKINSGIVESIENMGPEINTQGDEAYIIQNPSNKNFIFCRKNLGKSYDLYEGSEISEKDITNILKIRKKITLNNIQFERNSSEILPISLPTLKEVITYLKDNPDKNIKITGHTDLTGDLELNKILSENRSISVKKYFIENKIDSKRISTEGKGSKYPLVNSESDIASKKNRRTEFEILN